MTKPRSVSSGSLRSPTAIGAMASSVGASSSSSVCQPMSPPAERLRAVGELPRDRRELGVGRSERGLDLLEALTDRRAPVGEADDVPAERRADRAHDVARLQVGVVEQRVGELLDHRLRG